MKGQNEDGVERLENGQTRLMLAVTGGDLKSVAALIESEPLSINAADGHGKTALHLALEQPSSRDLCRLLIPNCDVSVADGFSRTPLHVAAARGLLGEISSLLAKGASACCRDARGATPLHIAASQGLAEACQLLKAAWGVRDGEGRLPIDVAIGEARVVVRSAMVKGDSIDGGSNINAQEGQKEVPVVVVVKKESSVSAPKKQLKITLKK